MVVIELFPSELLPIPDQHEHRHVPSQQGAPVHRKSVPRGDFLLTIPQGPVPEKPISTKVQAELQPI